MFGNMATMPTAALALMGWMAGFASAQLTGNIQRNMPSGQYDVGDYLDLARCNRWMRDAVTANRWDEAADVFINGKSNDSSICANGKAPRWYVSKDSFLDLEGPNTYRGFYQYYDNDRFFLNTLAKRYVCASNFGGSSRLRRLLEEDDIRGETTRDAYCSGTNHGSLPLPSIREGLIKLPQILIGLVNGFAELEESIISLGKVSREETRYIFGEGYAFLVGRDSGAGDSSFFYTVFRREEDFSVTGNQLAIRDAYQKGFDAISAAGSMTGTSGSRLKVELTELIQKISARFIVTMMQGIERYVHRLDTESNSDSDSVNKWREEMRLFYYGLAPFVASLDKDVHEELDLLMKSYDSSSLPSNKRCEVRRIFEYVVQSMYAYDVSLENYGALRNTGSCPENDLLKVPNALALPLGSRWHTPYLPDGIRRLATDTKNYALLSYDVCEIIEGVREKQWEKAIHIYVQGKNAPEKSLYSYAVKPEPSSVTWQRFRNAFGSETFIDDHVKEYFCSNSRRRRSLLEEEDFVEDADPTTYCSGYEGNPRGYEHASQMQAIPKAMQNWIGIYMSTVEFEKAVSQVEKGEISYGVRPSASHSLSEAYLFYTGARPGDDCSAYETTNKRALNFGVDNQRQILQAYRRANDELKKDNPSAVTVRRAYEEVTSLHLIVYAKGVTRYAYYLDKNAEERIPPIKYGTEGKTFYNIIMPYVASVDPEGARRVTEIFADENTVMEANQNYYCQVEEVMNCFVRSMESYGVSVQQNYGRLEEAVRDGISCRYNCNGRTLDYRNPDNAAVSFQNPWLVFGALVSFLFVM